MRTDQKTATRRAKLACRKTAEGHLERIFDFVQMIKKRETINLETVLIANPNDRYGGPLAEHLVPGFRWQNVCGQSAKPFARGIVKREGMQKIFDRFDWEAADKLQTILDDVPIIVADHGVMEVFLLKSL
ncbi:MAG TPA: hypothetical protein VFM02_00820 [Candidatus Paceibacterota bacterium]|nr:hypothetical protein [Candidatus Paceibacterota bacterium]